MRDAGNLLTRAGLGIPSVDMDEITVHYNRLAELYLWVIMPCAANLGE